jgi:hypothetical protein
MKIPLPQLQQMMSLFLRSCGSPKSLIDLVEMLQKEGFTAFQFQPVSDADPNWNSIGADPERTHHGIWIRAVGPNSRITAGIFFEGSDDKMLEAIDSLSGGALLAPADSGAQPRLDRQAKRQLLPEA